ncbi:MAG TPA: hypothetical protein VGK93_00070 [Candidatus Eisenbacteria bacterium]|jgi:hypothetical protein
MNDREPDRIQLRHPLEREHRAYQRALILRHALRAAASSVVAIALGVVLGTALALGQGGASARLGLVLAACLAAVGLAVGRFHRASLALDGFLERAEDRFPPLKSWLRNAIDLERHPSAHTSPALAQAVSAETRRRLADAPLAVLVPRIETRRPALAIGLALLVLLGLAAAWPARVTRSWATLWNPAAAAPPVRLAVEPGSVTVTPGAALAVRARVWGADRAPRLLRDREAAPAAAAEGRAEDGARLWRFDLSQLTREQIYRVRVASVESPRYRISLSGELSPVSFEVEYHAPSYARLPVQRGAAARGDLTALRGTRAHLVVTFDRDLSGLTATLPGGRTDRWSALTPRRWAGDVSIDRDGEYVLGATAVRRTGWPNGPGERRFAYRVTPVEDAAPVITVRVPEGDVDLPAGQRIPVEVLAQDDLGLSELKLQYRKDAADPWTDMPLAGFPARPREAQVTTRWDAAPLALLPGESATFRFELFDDNALSGRGRAVSPTFELRFPSLADLYQRVDRRQADAQTTLEKVAEQARELQKSLDKLSRQPQPPNSESPQSFERSAELKATLDRQQQIAQRIDEASQQLRESVEQAAERQAFEDQLMRKLRELNELMEQIQSREFKDAMRTMREALENMDRVQPEQDLARWRQQNQEMLDRLERTAELLKKLREEERLESLAQRARELKTLQDAMNEEHAAEPPSRDQAEPQAEALEHKQLAAADETSRLAEEAQKVQQESQDSKREQDLGEAAAELSNQAAPSQREAARAASNRQKNQAQQAGQRASQSLLRAAQRLDEVAKEARQQQNELDLAALRRAAQDLVSLQRTSEQTLSSKDSPAAKADRQTDLSEGTARVADSLFALSRQTPFISPQLAEALGRAITQLGQSGRELGAGNRLRGEEAGRSGSHSLNQAVLELRATEGAMCDKPGPATMTGRSNPQQIGQMGQRQSQLNRDTRSLAQRLSQQLRLSAGDRDQMRRLAEEQARIRQQLEEVRRDEESHRELLGKLDPAEREMKEVEEVLRSGTSDADLEQKQQRILSRLLDAQRSINRRDFDPERESRPGEDVVRASPPELAPELLRVNDRLRHDLLKAESDRYPAQYRAFVEAYLRSLNGSPR